MKRSTLCVIAGAAVALLLVGLVPMAQAAGPAGMKLYAFSSGALTVPRSLLASGTGSEQVQVPVGMFLVKHPKGTFVFDTGNNDKIINDPSYWGPFVKALNAVRTPDVAVDVWLRKAGVTAADVTYVAVGHMHLDHGGNVCKFTNAIFFVQKDEIRNAAWPDPGSAGPYIPGDVACLRSDIGQPLPNKHTMMMLDGDWDVFGDGSVVLKKFPGHTPGSQMAVVRLPRTGTVILTSDNVYFAENITKNLLPDVALAWSPNGIMAAYNYIRVMQASEGASFMTAHDLDGPAAKAMHSHEPQVFE
jgi:glyoxylase-like metal-dependent hydrolase (beta-lactamase superfamily II)